MVNGDEDVLLICCLLVLQSIIFISQINFVSIDVNSNGSNKKKNGILFHTMQQASTHLHPHHRPRIIAASNECLSLS